MSSSFRDADSTTEYMAFDDDKKTNRNLCIAITVLAIVVLAALAAVLVVVFVVHPSNGNNNAIRSSTVPNSAARSADASNSDQAFETGASTNGATIEPSPSDIEAVPDSATVDNVIASDDASVVASDDASADLVITSSDASPAPIPAVSSAGDTMVSSAADTTTWTPYVIPRSSKRGQILLLRDNSKRRNGVRRIVARSYDNRLWETVSDQDFAPIKISCAFQRCRNQCKGSATYTKCFRDCRENACSVTSPAGTYQVIEMSVPEYLKKRSAAGKASKFLQQTTFGPTKREIDSLVTNKNNFLQWINAQVKLQPTYLRTHYRQRVNAYQPQASFKGDLIDVCDAGSRWHRYAFGIRDEGQLVQVSSTTDGVSAYTLSINGTRFAEVTSFNGKTFPTGENRSFRICRVTERVGGDVIFSPAGGTCGAGNWKLPNPAIKMTHHDSTVSQWVRATDIQLSRFALNKDVRIFQSMSRRCAGRKKGAIAFFRVSGVYYRYDPRLKLQQNTVEHPSTGSLDSEVMCPTVNKNFINENHCVRRGSCSTVTFTSKRMTLDQGNLRFWYTANRRYVYSILGVRLEPPYNVSPCSGHSRWRRLNTTCTETALDSRTRAKFRDALSASTDTNPYVKDLNLDGRSCTANAASIGAIVRADGLCYQHVHPHLYDVRDATYWAGPSAHPGNAVAAMGGRPNPIKQFAKQGDSYLTYPSWHGMERWGDRNAELPRVGRLGDEIDFRALSTDLQTMEMAVRVGAVNQGIDDASALTCGSRAEVANVPAFGNLYQLQDRSAAGGKRAQFLDYRYNLGSGKSMIWQNVALTAPDQLRHRVAWALAQICTISAEGLGAGTESDIWTTYYDIFVHNAFGNYGDILREVSYSPLMADYLSYRGNRALAVSGNYPDENYAREIMQLFSIGLWKLRPDGSQILDKRGNPIDSYTNEDIVDFARLWTGFDRQQPRGNMEKGSGTRGSPNLIDPMQIKPEWRDFLPKANLARGYLGDTYPLCDKLPYRHWLRKGATYVYTGEKSDEGPLMDAENASNVGKRGRFTAIPGSPLYRHLCRPNGDGQCTFPAKVTLGGNIGCSSSSGVDCTAASVSTVKVVDTSASITRYYTYVPPPCVRLTFFRGGRLVSAGGTDKQCAPRQQSIAVPVCCKKDNAAVPIWSNPGLCKYANEEMNWYATKRRCESLGHVLCNGNYTRNSNWDRSCASSRYQWTDAPCNVKIQVYGSGRIGIVDSSATSFSMLQQNSFSNFRVFWFKGGTFPKAPNCGAGCRVVSSAQGDTCLCDFAVRDSPVFRDPSKLPTATQVVGNLFNGAPEPISFGRLYERCTTTVCQSRTDVRVWVKRGTTKWDMSTIFELAPRRRGGRRRFLFNSRSIVTVNDHSFRNPPAFMPLAGEQARLGVQWTSGRLLVPRAEQEVEALLEHLFEHQNTAPFVAYRLIQRLVTSNPSPRYMSNVVNSFTRGYYGKRKFSGKYGDLLAAVNAILLDPEARNDVLEAEPNHGQLREPLLKVMHLMRSLEFKNRVANEVALDGLKNKIGMEPFRQPSVFGYYLPEHRPDGAISDSGLVAPEMEIATGPLFSGYMNGVASLMDHGLTSCFGGFGQYWHPNGRNCRRISYEHTDGNLTFAPTGTAQEIVSQLSLVLTADRLHPTSRNLFVREYTAVAQSSSAANAMKRLLKLFALSADFHVTNSNIQFNTLRPAPTTITGSGRRYKAIVVVFEAGGADSFNMVVPHSGCSNGDYYAEYNAVRQGAAIAKPKLHQISTTGQVCSTFGLHPAYSTVRDLYNQKDAAILANIGALVEPVTPADYKGTSGRFRKFPPSLFAHNAMQRSMHNLHAQNIAAKGILGRIVHALRSRTTGPFSSALYSLMGNVKMVEGSVPPFFIDQSEGIQRFRQYRQFAEALEAMTKRTGRSAFAETYNRVLNHTISQSEQIGALLDSVTLSTTFGTNTVSKQLQQVAKIIKMRDATKNEREVFIVNKGGWDTHNTFDLDPLFGDVDSGLKSFVQEMKSQGIWNDVVVLSVSDFGRTLTSNGQGTDHAWGGNHFVASGSLKGGKMLGTFPNSLTDDGDRSIGRGRVIPSSPWELVWNGIAQWFGVENTQMNKVLPNAQNFPNLPTRNDLFN